MSGLVGLLSSAFGGGLIGSIGSFAQKWLEGKTEKDKLRLELEHEEKMASHEKSMAELQLSSKQSIAEVEASTEKFTADMSALEASMEADRATYATVDTTKTSKWFVFVDVIRGLVRPTLTGALAAYCVAVTVYNLTQHGDSFPAEEMAAVTFALIDSMATFTGLAISWWFGTRTHMKRK